MNCRQVNRIMVKYLYMALSEKASRAVQAHLADCADCRRRLDSFHRNRADVTTLTRGRPGSSLSRAAVTRWRQESRKPASAPNAIWGRTVAWTLGFAVCALFALLVLLQMRPSTVRVAIHPELHPAPTPRLAKVSSPSQQEKRKRPDRRINSPVSPDVRDLREPAPQFAEAPAAQEVDDLNYINTDPERAVRGWGAPMPLQIQAASVHGDAVRETDDFVYVAPPRIASSDPRATALAAAKYRQEKAIVDARLGRKVNLAVKGLAFADLCKQLTRETGVGIHGGRTVADEKVTIFCEQQPLRDLMRQITHLFGYSWERSGEEGAYHYELFQTNRALRAEGALRHQDLDAAMMALDAALDIYKPFLKLSRAELLQQLRDSLKQAPKDRNLALKMEETPLRKANDWGTLIAVQMLSQLTPAEQEALRNGQEVRFSTDLRPGYGTLSPEMSQSLLDTIQFTTPEGTFNGQSPGAASTITLSIDQSELGELSLTCETAFSCSLPRSGVGSQTVLATGRSPSTAKPDNRAANKGSEHDLALQREITLRLKACNKPDVQTLHGIDANVGLHIEDAMEMQIAPPTRHVNSADVWEEIHRQSGLPIVADYYTRLYPLESFDANVKKLFDVLCQVGDTLGARWKKDGAFLQCRTASFYWDKMKEAPNRLLDKWRKDREQNDGLPFDDFLEMARLSDLQLNSAFVGQGVRHCLGLEEWSILNNSMTRRKYDTVRPLARFLADLPKSQLLLALGPEGLPLEALPAGQQEAISHLMMQSGTYSSTLTGVKMRVEYIPSNLYVWHPTYDSWEEGGATFPQEVAEKTPERALAAAKQVYAKAEARDIRRTYGILAATFTMPDGTQGAIGKQPRAVRVHR